MNIEKASFLGLLVLVTVAFFALLLDFLEPVFWASALAVIFHPLHTRIVTLVKQRNTAASFLTLIVIIAGGGLTYIAGEMVPLRFGYRRDSGRSLNQLTAGIGFTRNKIAVEGSLRQDIGGRKETYLLFMFRFVVQ